ncbi:unnamed protein product [Didymodactylos carnosus]|uniref:Uncharacterized protein n=1 Tax=Didymodactylos carnosus TaxID=1234261 RepID=A0A814I427_9BILA|nr:unnamed protein product [Didymodactylos carnosus]CAF1019320.1 unnamed protein product [Didymodactylos carnosus]CAF3645379.1 unnamed protein product [Didymodactylos carnosus]CAF3790832.1 unnamed protein product [Didymodactylos carnosus]
MPNENFGGVNNNVSSNGILQHPYSTNLIQSFAPTAASLDSSSLSPIDDGDNQSEELVVGAGGNDVVITKIDPEHMTAEKAVTVRAPPLLLQEPKYRKYRLDNTSSNQNQVSKKNIESIIYQVSIGVGVLSLILTLWKPLSSSFSGFIVGFLFPMAVAYILFKNYVNKKANEQLVSEWVEFPELEQLLAERAAKEDKASTINETHAEIIFDRYDADNDDKFVRYPCLIRLDQYRVIIQLPTKPISESEKKEQEVTIVGYREYSIKEANLILVPEATLTRAKYWLVEYPIVIQNLQILDKTKKNALNKQSFEKTKFDADHFFDNPSTVLSLFFQTGPEKEDWFHKLSLMILKGKEEIERHNRLLSAPSGSSIPSMESASAIPSLDNARARRKDNSDQQPQQQQQQQPPLNVTATTKEERGDLDEKDSSGTLRTAATVETKQSKLQDRTSLEKLLQSPDCLDEAAITMNFLVRRLLCDMFQDSKVFTDAIKEKAETKLKEISAVSIQRTIV